MRQYYCSLPKRDRFRNHRLARGRPRPRRPTRRAPGDALLVGAHADAPAGALGGVRLPPPSGSLSGVHARKLRVAQEGLKVSEQQQEPEPEPQPGAGQGAQRGQEEQTGQGVQNSGLPQELSPLFLPAGCRHGRISSSAPGLLGRSKPRQ